jgi:hypothetical protein
MRHVFEQFGAQMLRRADAGMAIGKLAGLRFASATSSATVLTGSSGGTASTFAAMNTCEIGAKSSSGSNGSVSYRLGLMTSDELPPISSNV